MDVQGWVVTLNQISFVVILDQLEELLTSAPGVPMTGKRLVDIDEVLRLVEKLRIALPDESQAGRWADHRERQAADESRRQADRIVEQARKYAARLASEEEIVKAAKEKEKEIIEAARIRATEIEQGANEYADTTLARLERSLEDILRTVKNGRNMLKGQSE